MLEKLAMFQFSFLQRLPLVPLHRHDRYSVQFSLSIFSSCVEMFGSNSAYGGHVEI